MIPTSSHVTGIRVDLGPRSYDVLVGPGACSELADMVPVSARQAVVVTQAGIGVADRLQTGLPTTVVEVPPGERAKSLATVETLSRRFAAAGLTRSDVVIGVGGGVVTDLAGFAAACWHRGTGVIHVATTLLAQIDAAIGGKTGVNLPEGKNLVGAFWQPLGVICDTDVLSSLPPAEWRSGRGELAKYAFLGVDDLDGLDVAEQVARCVECKAQIVSADETEGGLRMVLNYGHTLAHALEASSFGPNAKWDLLHGEAVAIGLVFAAILARRLDRIDDDRVALHRRVVAGFDLYADIPVGASAAQLLEFMARDKKARHDLTFVLDGPKGVEAVRGVDEAQVLATLADMGCAP